MKIVNPSVQLVAHTPDPERLIERMGRICYQSNHKVKICERCNGTGVLKPWTHMDLQYPCNYCDSSGTDKSSAIKFVEMIKKNGHESVLEHASASFSVVTDRGITHETVRHRIASFSQESSRYCNYMKEVFGKEISVIIPPFKIPDKSLEIFIKATEVAEKAYFDLLEAGEPPELARSVLPTCLKSEIGVTANFREWRHFLRLRTSPKAHPQMREIAELIKKKLLEISEVCFNDI
jgi:thymidylate synthase (FAD)